MKKGTIGPFFHAVFRHLTITVRDEYEDIGTRVDFVRMS